MDTEIYGDITAESGSISGDFDITGDVTVDGTITVDGFLYMGSSSMYFTNAGYAQMVMQNTGDSIDLGFQMYTGHNVIEMTTGKYNSGTGQYEAYVQASTDDLGLRPNGASVILHAESDGGDYSLWVDSHNHKFAFEVDGADLLEVNSNGLYFYESGGSSSQGLQFEDSGGATRWALRFDATNSPPFVALSNRASNGEVRIYANTSTAGSSGETLVATFEDTHLEIADGIDIRWANQSSKPVMIMDSTGSGDTWTDQGAHIVMGEQASSEDSAAAALHITYTGDGKGYVGMGALTSGKPAYGIGFHYTTGSVRHLNDGTAGAPSYSWDSDTDMGIYKIAAGRFGISAQGTKVGEFGGYSGTSSNYFNIRWGDGFVSRPAYAFFNDIDTGMYLFGTNELGFAAGGGDNLLVGTYGFKVNTSKDILPRTDNSSQLGASGARYIDVWAVDTSINSSDATQKEDFGPIPFDAMAFVNALPMLSWRRKGRSRFHLGPTAQDVKAAMDRVGFDWAAYIDPEYGGVPEGKREEDGFGHGPKGLRQAELVPVLWEAVQKLDARVKELEARLDG